MKAAPTNYGNTTTDFDKLFSYKGTYHFKGDTIFTPSKLPENWGSEVDLRGSVPIGTQAVMRVLNAYINAVHNTVLQMIYFEDKYIIWHGVDCIICVTVALKMVRRLSWTEIIDFKIGT